MKHPPNPDGSPRRKETFGGATIDHFVPAPGPGLPKALNVVLSFEEALKLHLSLGQALGHLNGYDRATRDGKRTAISLRVYTENRRVTVNESKVIDKPGVKIKGDNGEASL